MNERLRHWSELRTTDFAGLDPERTVAVLPVGAVEQHGPHLPLGTDCRILQALLERLPARLDGRADVLVLPLQSVGDSVEHSEFAGTLHLRAETALEAWTQVGRAVADAGLRKLAIVNSHGGQPQVVDLVAQRLRAERRMLVARVNTFLLGLPEGLFGADELAFGFHGGEVETSMMLAVAPGSVDMTAARSFSSLAAELARENSTLHAEPIAGAAGFAWQAQDLNPAGVTGNAAAADPERGAAALDHVAGRVAEALAELAAFPLSYLRDGER